MLIISINSVGWRIRVGITVERTLKTADGRYYEVALSISRNGEVNEVYNVGQMRQKKNTASSLGSSVRKDGARTAIIDSDNDISVLNPSIAPDEPLSNSLFDSLTPEQLAKLLGEDKRYTFSPPGGPKEPL